VTPDGRRAVSSSWDNTLRVWDLESARCLHTLERNSGEASKDTSVQSVFSDVEDYADVLHRGLESTRPKRGSRRETLAHLAALAIHLKKEGKHAEAGVYQREYDARHGGRGL